MKSTFSALCACTPLRASSGVVGFSVGAPGYGPVRLNPCPAVYTRGDRNLPAFASSYTCMISGLSLPVMRRVVTPQLSATGSSFRMTSSG